MRGFLTLALASLATVRALDIFSIGGIPADVTQSQMPANVPANVLVIPTNYKSTRGDMTLTVQGMNLDKELTPARSYIRLGKMMGTANPCSAFAAAPDQSAAELLSQGTPDATNELQYTFTLSVNVDLCDFATAALPGGCTAGTNWNRVGSDTDSDMRLVNTELKPIYRPLCVVKDAASQAAAMTTDGEFAGLFATGTFDCKVQDCANRRTTANSQYSTQRLSLARLDEFNAETSCAQSALGFTAGTCYNANVANLCGARPYAQSATRCCDSATETTADIYTGVAARTAGQRCPCRRNVNGATGNTISTRACPSGEECCVREKYFSEFGDVLRTGSCINRNDEKCCDTGEAFNPDTHQCCKITGATSLDEQCPCEVDADCQLSSTVDTGAQRTASAFDSTRQMSCCAQTRPVDTRLAVCSEYANYPTGSIAMNTLTAANTRCRGVCIDTAYQTCCNGAVCMKEYERCCNSTCYNVFTQSCSQGRMGVMSPSNGHEFGLAYNKPTSIEAMNPIKAFWVFILPTMLLLAGFGALAIVLTFATKASYRNFSFVERSMMFLSIAGILFAVPLFFSPAYKYGVVVLLCCSFLVLVASTRVKFITVAAVVASLLTLAFLVDPFAGSDYLSLASDRTSSGRTLGDAAGIFHSVARNFPSAANFEGTENQCVRFYETYFYLDAGLQDAQRFDNPTVQTFGYCSRGWTLAVLIFSGAVFVVMLLLFLLSLIALLLRFRPKGAPAPVELALVPQY